MFDLIFAVLFAASAYSALHALLVPVSTLTKSC